LLGYDEHQHPIVQTGLKQLFRHLVAEPRIGVISYMSQLNKFVFSSTEKEAH